jgi:hypothetical protein
MMKICIRFLAMILLLSQAIFCDKGTNAKEIIYIPDTKDAKEATIQILLAREGKKASFVPENKRETLEQTLSDAALCAVTQVLPGLVIFLIEFGQGKLLDYIASKVPQLPLISESYLEISTRHIARIALQGVSHIALWSLLKGAPDEHGDFKLHFNKETVIDGVNASLQYAMVQFLITPYAHHLLKNNELIKSYYERLPKVLKSSNCACGNIKDLDKAKKWYADSIGEGVGKVYKNVVYEQLKRQAMRE